MIKNTKKQAVIVLALVLSLALVLGAVMIIGLCRTENDAPETVKPSVIIPPSPPESNGAETFPPLPHDGKVFRILCGQTSLLGFGDDASADGNVSRLAYERNELICSSLGVTIAFDYTANVYQTYTDLLRSGVGRYDLLSVNMLLDGSKFLMNGGLDNVISSSLDLSSGVFDKSFLDTFTYDGRCGFLLGEANPSRILSANALFVSKSAVGAEKICTLARSGELTCDALFETLLENQTVLRVDNSSFHALLSAKGIFTFSYSGEGEVNNEGYVYRYATLFSHIKSGVIAEAEQSYGAVFINSLSSCENFENYYVLPMPKYSSSDGYTSMADMSALFAFAVPSLLTDVEKTYDVIEQMYVCSDGFTSALAKELSLGEADLWIKNINYCLYDVFGWGDFSDHAWKAFSQKQDAEAFSSNLVAPTRAAKQALLILSERMKTHYKTGIKSD